MRRGNFGSLDDEKFEPDEEYIDFDNPLHRVGIVALLVHAIGINVLVLALVGVGPLVIGLGITPLLLLLAGVGYTVYTSAE